MTAWDLGGGGHDVLSSGQDAPSPPGRVQTALVAVVCLVLGGLVGARLDGQHAGAVADMASQVDLRAGEIREIVPCAHECLRLAVFNGGSTPVRVTEVGFDDWHIRGDALPVVVPPGAWENVRFGLPVDCESPEPPYFRTVHVRTSSGGDRGQLSLQLPNAVPLVRAQHDRYCPEGRPVTPQDLRGVWMLEWADGVWHDLAAKLLLRFSANGSFAWDSTGHLFDPVPVVDGRYEVSGHRLELTVDDMTVCRTGGTFTWRVTLTAPDELHLRYLRGRPRGCRGSVDDVWIAHRMLLDHRLPEMRALR